MVRTFGALGMIGGLAYAAGGVRMLLFGVGEDRLTDVFGVVWAACWIAGGLGLLQLRVTGTTVWARIASIVLIAGFTAATLWGSYRLVDPEAADHSIFAIAPMIVIIGMLATGVLAPHGKVLSPLHRWIPLLIGAVYVATVALSVTTGQLTLQYAFTGAGILYIVLGHAIRVTADRLQSAPAAKEPLTWQSR